MMQMVDTIHLFLKANGTDIQGESTQTSLGRENSIECLALQQSAKASLTNALRGSSKGIKRSLEPIKFTKRIDKSSPLLMKALCEQQVINGKFLFFRPNPTGDGTTEQYYTIEVKQGRIAAINIIQADVLDPANISSVPMEEVSIVYHTASWTYTNGGVMHEATSNA